MSIVFKIAEADPKI